MRVPLASVLLLRGFAVETLLRKYLWAVDLAIVALCATFLGMAASGAVESKVASLPVPARPPVVRVAKTEAKLSFNKDPTGILKRNVFCSTCPSLLDDPNQPAEPEEFSVQQTKTALPIALLAVMYAPPPNGMRWSVAIMRDTEEKSMGAYPVGGKIHGATVTEILETRVYLDNEGKAEYIDLFEKPAPPQPPPSAPAPTTSKDDVLAADLAAGIKKTSENGYELKRNTLESVLGNMALLSRSARIVPEMKDGKAAGFRLFAVRPDGPFALIGMQNGDIISSINGLEITSPEKALEVYAKLKSASHLSLGMERNGQKLTKEYNIR
jgi:general secretion pathway protein C